MGRKKILNVIEHTGSEWWEAEAGLLTDVSAGGPSFNGVKAYRNGVEYIATREGEKNDFEGSSRFHRSHARTHAYAVTSAVPGGELCSRSQRSLG